MKNYEELEKAMRQQSKICRCIESLKMMEFVNPSYQKLLIHIRDGSFRDIESAIGEEKLQSLLDQFKGLINVELQRLKEDAENEISKFEVIRNG